jgi:hypothetical protein
MEQITGSKKFQNGIQVSWTAAGRNGEEFFSYEELIDMKINALDILNNPRLYRIDSGNHRIESSV